MQLPLPLLHPHPHIPHCCYFCSHMHTYLCRTQISHPSIDEPPLTFLPRAALACQPSRHRPAFFGELSTLSQLPAYRSLPQDVPAGDVNSFIPPTPRAALSPPTADASSLESGVASKGYHAPRLPRSIPPRLVRVGRRAFFQEHHSSSSHPHRLMLDQLDYNSSHLISCLCPLANASRSSVFCSILL
jgi:hypothetical protein